MENIAHSLVGLLTAKAGLERLSPGATSACVIAANLPDGDVLAGVYGRWFLLEHHRGITHSILGVLVLPILLTATYKLADLLYARIRSKIAKVRFWPLLLASAIACATHPILDWTNNYGIRPFLPWSGKWFYGDLVFIVDPWIWLILGSTAVWLTTTDATRIFLWLVIGIILALIMGLALRHPSDSQAFTLPTAARLIWFFGLVVVVAGSLFRWGRAGQRLSRYSLLVLALYYCGMWMAHQSAMKEAQNSLKVTGVTSMAAWPAVANPLSWQAAAKTSDAVYMRNIELSNRQDQWRELPALDPKLAEALRRSKEARVFLDFMRYGSANVEERPDGTTVVELHDLRFDLRMRAELDRDMNVTSTQVRWF